jgi:muramoyltetrapeptide carboxypeptidase
LERTAFVAKATTLCEKQDWTLIVSPLMERRFPGGAWLPRGEREEDIRRALRHDIVIGFRGGYGAVELVPALLKARTQHKVRLLGFSDMTVLQAAWHKRRWGEGYYGTIPERWGGRQGASLLSLVRGDGFRLSSRNERAGQVLRAGNVTGRCFTACVSVLAGLCGTALQPDLRGCLLAIEDIDEKPYQVDFALHQLHLSGALRGLAGLLGGSFSHTNRSDYQGPTHNEILAGWAERLDIPCLARLPFGHVDDPYVMPNGRTITVNAKRTGAWALEIHPHNRVP